MGLRSIPPITSTGKTASPRISSKDAVKFGVRNFNFSFGIGSPGNNSSGQVPLKIYPIKKAERVRGSYILEILLNLAEKDLDKIMKKLKITVSDVLLDEHLRLKDLVNQLRWQIAMRYRRK